MHMKHREGSIASWQVLVGVLYLYLSVGTDGRHGQSGDDGYKIAKRHDHQALH